MSTYLAIGVDKCGGLQLRFMFDGTRRVTKSATPLTRHDFSMQWSFAEFDACRNLAPWVLDQVVDAYSGIANLLLRQSCDRFRPSWHLSGRSTSG